MHITDISGTTLLNNGVAMPYLGLGTYKTPHGKEVEEAVHDALEAGYRHIDTAAFYGNEEGVGNAVKKSGYNRNRIFITTKVWNHDHGQANTRKALEKSLSLLQTDYVDLYLIHWPVPGKFPETWETLIQLRAEGKARAIGVCNCFPHHIDEMIAATGVTPAVLQNEFHPRLVQQPILHYCKDRGIQYEAWAPLMRGALFNEKALATIARNHQKSIAQVVLRWDLQKGVVTIPKSTHRERIVANSQIFDFELSPLEMQQIDRLDDNFRTGAHPDDFIEYFREKGY